MKLAMISCAAYSDAWGPYFAFLEKFWSDHPFVTIVTDQLPQGAVGFESAFVAGKGKSWCEVLLDYAKTQTESLLVMQEDFFLTANVKSELIAAAAAQLGPNVGGVRIYPCPGGYLPLRSDVRVGIAGPQYRISCQSTIWSPSFLVELMEAIGPGSAAHFEIEGSRRCEKTMLAWMRECRPWPIEYLCSAICKGSWMPDVREFCERHGVSVDWSKRPTQAAVSA